MKIGDVDKKAVLMSIHQKWWDAIARGEKRWELRKTKPQQPVGTILFYVGAKVRGVVGYVRVLDVVEGTPADIWKRTKSVAGISKEEFDQYYKGSAKAVAFFLGRVVTFEAPQKISNFGVKTPKTWVYIERPPQSWVYVDL